MKQNEKLPLVSGNTLLLKLETGSWKPLCRYVRASRCRFHAPIKGHGSCSTVEGTVPDGYYPKTEKRSVTVNKNLQVPKAPGGVLLFDYE
jgi:hypothetical protein